MQTAKSVILRPVAAFFCLCLCVYCCGCGIIGSKQSAPSVSATVSPDGLVTKNQETWALATDPYVGSNNGMIVAVTETYIQICMNKQGLSYEVEPYSTSQGTSIVASGGGRLLFNEKIAAKYGYSGLFIIEGVGVRAALGVLWPGRGRGLPMMGVPTPSI